MRLLYTSTSIVELSSVCFHCSRLLLLGLFANMPPRKRQRLSPESSQPTPAANSHSPSQTPTPRSPSYTTAAEPMSPSDTTSNAGYWDNSSTTALFKSLIRHKPSGPHKHFRMLAISQDLSNSLGYYVSVPSIWAKLEELYDLSALDARETAYAFGRPDEDGTWPDSLCADFRLPGEPERHGPAEVEMEETTEEANDKAIAHLWQASNEDEMYFMDEIWKRRFAAEGEDGASDNEGADEDEEEDEEEVDEENEEEEEEVQSSPAPSTAPSTTKKRRGRKPKRARAQKESKASSTPPAEDDTEQPEDDDEEDGDTKATRSTRRSARSRK